MNNQKIDKFKCILGGLFGLSAIFSFLAPVVAKCRKTEDAPIHVEVLTPIDEEADENDPDDPENEPITMSKLKG